MTRFEQEICGQLGEFWKKNAEKEVERTMKMFAEDGEIEEDGAARWIRSGHYVPKDVCQMLIHGGLEISEEATKAKRDAQDDEFLKNYRKNRRPMTDEDRYEMAAAFGKGAKVVDVLTGETLVC